MASSGAQPAAARLSVKGFPSRIFGSAGSVELQQFAVGHRAEPIWKDSTTVIPPESSVPYCGRTAPWSVV